MPWHAWGMTAASYNYEITVYSIDREDGSTPPIVVIERFNSDNSLHDVLRQVGDMIARHEPPIDLDDRIEVKNDNPEWPNDYKDTAENWIPANMHRHYPRKTLNR